MSELAFEYLLLGQEVTPGTVVDPTHYASVAGTIVPAQERYRAKQSMGVLAEYARNVVTRQSSQLSGDGALDLYTLPLLLEGSVKGGVSAVRQGTATAWAATTGYVVGNLVVPAVENGRYYRCTTAGTTAAGAPTWPTTTGNTVADGTVVWTDMGPACYRRTYNPTMNADDLVSLCAYWGDPNVRVWEAGYYLLDQLTIGANSGGGTDAATMSFAATGHFPATSAIMPADVPAMLEAPLLVPSEMQVWVDEAGAIGTTELAGRVISAEFSLPTGISRKWIANGPGNGKGFYRHGRGLRHAELKLVLELEDTTQYDQWADSDMLKVRCRLNGPTAAEDLLHFVQFDVYGCWDAMAWGELEGTNRTIELSVLSEYNTYGQAAGHDFQVIVQNDRITV